MKKWGMIGLVLVASLMGFIWRTYDTKPKLIVTSQDITSSVAVGTQSSIDAQSIDEIYVQVSGEVKQPGVFKVAVGTRCFEVIMLAGGVTSSAALESVNQAAEVNDGQMIIVKSIDQFANDSAVNQSSGVNINTASIEQLMELSGVGESRAKDIIFYRENEGGFKKIEDIMKVPGIKEGLYNKIKDQIII